MMEYFTRLASREDSFQTTEPVVDVIVECLQAESPKLRYPTSAYVLEILRGRYSDSDNLGASLAEQTYQKMTSDAGKSA